MTIRKFAISTVKAVVALLCIVPSLTCCDLIYEWPDPAPAIPVKGANLRLSLKVPATKAVAGTLEYGDSMNNEGMDNALVASDMDVFFFDTQRNFVTMASGSELVGLIKSSSDNYNPHYHLYDAYLKVDGLVDNTEYRVVIAANKRASFLGQYPFSYRGTAITRESMRGKTEKDLYDMLSFSFYNSSDPKGFALQNYTKYSFDMFDEATVPMWGYADMTIRLGTSTDESIPADIQLSGSINLLRSIAKVRIDFPVVLEKAHLTAFNSLNRTGGIRLYSYSDGGYMTPPYDNFKLGSATPEILNKDRVGGEASAAFTDAWVHDVAYRSSVEIYPFFKSDDGHYYIYLPEHKIGKAWMMLEFEFDSPATSGRIVKDFRLDFAEYTYTDGNPVASSKSFFPVMRNHYYVYSIEDLNYNLLKYQVCDWNSKSTAIEFN